eukprot:scaffold5125_cov156-Amphora_coffeaeformis.AAC.9
MSYISQADSMSCKQSFSWDQLKGSDDKSKQTVISIDEANNVVCITGNNEGKNSQIIFKSDVADPTLIVKLEKMNIENVKLSAAGTLTHNDILYVMKNGSDSVEVKKNSVVYGTIFSRDHIKLKGSVVVGSVISAKTLELNEHGRIVCGYDNSDVPLDYCAGEACTLVKNSCTLKLNEPNFVFTKWPERAGDITVQIRVVDTGEVFEFSQDTTGFLDYRDQSTSTYKDRPEFFLPADMYAVLRPIKEAGGSLEMQFVNADGPGGWILCYYSPIGFDIWFNGYVERIYGNFTIDIDGDADSGIGENHGDDEFLHEWFGPSVGILVHDPPADGAVSGEHLLGDMGGEYLDGYDKLASFDLNEDGIISGDELTGFYLWVDANSNAHLDYDLSELTELSDYGIVSIFTNHTDHKSWALLADGTKMMTEDLWFSRR